MRRILMMSVVVATFVPFAFGGHLQSASGKTYTLANRLAPTVAAAPESSRAAPHVPSKVKTLPPSGTGECPDASATNVRANQDCTSQSPAGLYGRGEAQNETGVSVNPLNPNNVVVSHNDYRDGDSHCGVDASMNGGKTFGSRLAPVTFTAPGIVAARHYWDGGGDTSLAFDSTGEAYLMCQMFDRGPATADYEDAEPFGASAFLLFRSGDGGFSWSFDGSIVSESTGDGSDGIGLLDKEYMTIDNNPTSPHKDRIYVTWAQYDAAFSDSPTFFAYSDDHGNSWSTPIEISGKSQDLCPITFSSRTDFSCDESQFNDPFVAPNGDVYDVMVNANNCAGALRALGFNCPGGSDGDNHNQILIVKSTDGGTTWSSPVRVSNFYDMPDCFTYQGYDFGRACVPETGLGGVSIFRATNYPSGVALSNTQIVVNFGSYINRDSNEHLPSGEGLCTPAGLSPDTFLNLFDGVGQTDSCNNDIVRSVSNNGGAQFTGTKQAVTKLPTCSKELGGQLTDQWWQWTAKTPGGRAICSYYDRAYGTDQSTGYMDISLADGLTIVRVTDQSLPPSNEFPDANGYSLFLGDYTGIAIGSDAVAHPAWADTRNTLFSYDATAGADPRVLTPVGQDEDVYTASVPVPPS